jgi:hypothetical protein
MRLSIGVPKSTGAETVNSLEPTDAVAVEVRLELSGRSAKNRHRSCAPEFSWRGSGSPWQVTVAGPTPEMTFVTELTVTASSSLL